MPQTNLSKIDPRTAVALAALRVKYRQQAEAQAASQPPKRYHPAPHPKQQTFLALDCLEGFYGGAAGGGKSSALLMAALQDVHVPGYAALILRRTFAELSKPGALISMAQEWLGPSDATWSESRKQWSFPSGATLSFGYLEHTNDVYQYQSSEFQFIGFDELTQFSEFQYRYLFSRLRRREIMAVPLRIRSASNPGGEGHDWVKQRFLVEGEQEGRAYIPARLDDNPSLDQVGYVRSLANLDPVTRAQLLNGDWTARQAGAKFRREWFKVVEQAPADCRKVRAWDMAATEPRTGQDPDWTVGALVGLNEGRWYILDLRRMRGTPGAVEDMVKQTAAIDGHAVSIRCEQEPGASGKAGIDHYARTVLVGYDFKGVSPTGSKEVRANPVSSAAEAGNVNLVRGSWLTAFLDEIEAFPLGAHDDQVDALSLAFAQLGGVCLGEIVADKQDNPWRDAGRSSRWQ